MSQGTSIRKKLSECMAVLFVASGISCSAFACSCQMWSPEEIAKNEAYAFTKVKIDYPSISELWGLMTKRPQLDRPFKITILENIKGAFSHRELMISVGGVTACGTNVRYGETFYLVSQEKPHDEWSNHASLCNIYRSEEYASQVRKLSGK